MILRDAQAANLADAFFVVLHADHADDFSLLIFRDPEMIARCVHINGFDVVDVEVVVLDGVALGNLEARVLTHATAHGARDLHPAG